MKNYFRNCFFNKQKFVISFLGDLAGLLEAGLPLDRALEILEKETPEKISRKIFKEISMGVKRGQNFSDTLAKRNDFFPDFLSGLIRAAEQSGSLAFILKSAGEHLENSYQFKNKLKAQMIYPGIVLAVALLVLIFLGFVVFPNFKQVFEQNNYSLPFLTQVVFGFFNLFKKSFLAMALGGAAAVVLAKIYFKNKADRLLLQTPVVSEIIKKISLARFCQTLAVLLNSGAGLLDSLYISSQTVENSILRPKFSALPLWINRGLSFKAALEKIKFFPERLKQMVALAEETGSLGPSGSKLR